MAVRVYIIWDYQRRVCVSDQTADKLPVLPVKGKLSTLC